MQWTVLLKDPEAAPGAIKAKPLTIEADSCNVETGMLVFKVYSPRTSVKFAVTTDEVEMVEMIEAPEEPPPHMFEPYGMGKGNPEQCQMCGAPEDVSWHV